MFLKQLDLVGFKSFADRRTIDFVPGLTAVVGPNGSGKSNISDAVRWVLGEQSAKNLRGSKMEDVIFSGSDTRKPLNVAEITLTLDNSDHYLAIDYSEVSVTRRVYRSGDSEYLINNHPCRLKDVIDLFMDSGLGKEAYSVIGQGKVEEILSSKADERRAIFEEAAGVLKYKTRKTKAEKKLTETEENLYRVEDILHELETQVKPLEEQASVAKEYLAKTEELKQVEVGLLVKEIEQLHEQWVAEKENRKQLADTYQSWHTKVQESEAKLEGMRTDIQTLDDSIEELQSVLLTTSEGLEKAEGKRALIKERKKHAEENRDQYEQDIAKLHQEKTRLEQDIETQSEVTNQRENQLKELIRKLNAENQQLEEMDKQASVDIETRKAEYIDLLNEQASIRNEIRYLSDQKEKQRVKYERLEKDHKDILEKRQHVQNEIDEQQKQIASVQEKIDEYYREYKEIEANLKRHERTYEDEEKKLYDQHQRAQQLRSRKDVLEEMQQDYSGFFQGVKEMLKQRDGQFSGIHGAVAELIHVEQRYEQALEMALGAAQQHVVVQDEKTGRDSIQYLKQRRLGRATFLPLDVMKPRKISSYEEDILTNDESFVGVAKSLVQYDDVYEPVVANLIGNVIVATDVKGAQRLAKQIRYRYRIVTLEGDVINPGGSMTGGSVKRQNSQLLGRQREMEQLDHDLKEIDSSIDKHQKQIAEIKEKRTLLEEELERYRALGEETRVQEQEAKSRLQTLEMEASNYNDRLSLFDQEKQEFEKDDEEKRTRIAELEEKLTDVSEKAESIDAEIQRHSEQQAIKQSSKEELRQSVTDLKIQQAKEQEQLQHQQEMLARLKEEKTEIEASLEEKQETLRALDDKGDEEETFDSLNENVEVKRQEKEKTTTLISHRRQERLERQQAHDDLERELKEARRTLKQYDEQTNQLDVKINRLDVELDHRLQKLEGDYELTFEAAREQFSLTLDLEDAREQVKLIKWGIDELGTVNLGAIEEYERVYERYEFLLNQKQDLLEAKDTLHRVISEMDEEMTKRFQRTFEQIKEQFQQVFVELFGGGQADLLLTDPEDLLNTGVDIIAQPPGKKLQHLALLSGGERALTAIALLFSILKVRPVPFCILDEVEAALDEANVVRFAQYLNTFSENTQFIVVTHRKGTMEAADVLYGITMQESGVSKLVSVRLEEAGELIESNEQKRLEETR
ncbi:chromosome segregation protein SMC [Texcoconibacillus texcoconensis]|uniref:Chromosome partition protein Smc n=1 Tax=Texcoconibacillus texcoconensis TaxID=1095777 RepID=A0A840QL72_9BACI|nr:chromosome segregation protein SMC [Texcoconibacillus texcoconensis]MBB5172108.1 chromosome segregation protein [Texcoconibacillus texcoconensis]